MCEAMYPAGAPPKADDWTLDVMLKAAEACHKGGHPFGIGLGGTEDNVDTAGAIFQSFGANLVDAKGNITVKTDSVRRRSNTTRSCRSSCRRMRRPGTTPPTTSIWSPARAR